MDGFERIWIYVLIALVAVVLGAGTGVVIGGANSDPFETVVKTVARETRTVTETETVTKTKTKTETVTEAEAEAETIAEKPPTSSGADNDDADTDGCSDSYSGACLDPSDGANQLTCADVGEDGFGSIGDDPYGLDPDSDGIACEKS